MSRSPERKEKIISFEKFPLAFFHPKDAFLANTDGMDAAAGIKTVYITTTEPISGYTLFYAFLTLVIALLMRKRRNRDC